MASYDEIYRRTSDLLETVGKASCVKGDTTMVVEEQIPKERDGIYSVRTLSHGEIVDRTTTTSPKAAARLLAMHCSNPGPKTKEELELIKGMLPAIGIGTVVVVAIAVMGRVFTGRRVYAQDGQYLVSVRYPGQLNDIREFVQPHNPDVIAVYSQFGPDYWSLYDFVCRNIDYRRDWGEFWQTPSETLKGNGDCEDTSILLTSLIRAGGMRNAYVALGEYQGYGHAWCQLDGQILETTYRFAQPVTDPQDYCPYCIFNESEVVELWPGALGEVFRIRRDESTKLNLIAGASVSNPDASWVGPLIGSGIIAGAILVAASLKR